MLVLECVFHEILNAFIQQTKERLLFIEQVIKIEAIIIFCD